MGLENYRMRGQAQQEAQGISSTQREGGTTWFEPYRQPLQGKVTINGDEVEVLILQIGDQPGASDVFKCIDARTRFPQTVKAEHVRVTAIAAPAGAYLPLGAVLAAQTLLR